ncbi:hypothetical protein J2Y63_006451 [Shinella sp. BE166]|uniref:capsular polysaccharide export protein, LipB/KpsS family n=1 Tax=Shinella sp. BE166 TaxID=3373918 RepID=UPI003EB9AFE7
MIYEIAVDIGKAIYGYALLPWKRFRPNERPLRVLFAQKTPEEILEKYLPDERVFSFDGVPSRWDFYTKCVPLILADRRSGIYHAEGRLPRFIKTFSRRYHIPIENISSTKPAVYTSAVLAQGKPMFLYVTWIKDEDEALINRTKSDTYELLSFDIAKAVGNDDDQLSVSSFASYDPGLYRQKITRRLAPLRSALSGVIVTQDWSPAMRIVVGVCQELGIPTILFPQASMSIDHAQYYRDSNTQASLPICDVVLGWDRRQKEVFLERGYPAERFKSVKLFEEAAPIIDDNASRSIHNYLKDVATGRIKIEPMPHAMEKLRQGQTIDVAAIASSEEVLESTQMFLRPLLNVRTLASSLGRDASEMSAVELFFQWGVKSTDNKEHQRSLAQLLKKRVMIIEDGFIRSMKIGLSGEPGLSVIIDDTTSYYDATRRSGLERALQNGRELTDAEHQRALHAIRQIVDNRVSKYNHAPVIPITVGRAEKPKILVVDQRRGDQSVESGLANRRSFKSMLLEAISTYPEHDILVKVHPDAISGGKSGYYTDELSYVPEEERYRVFLVSNEVNPFVLIDLAESVFVVSSGMGFEALMAGKPVHCYGVPFYSGWGATIDHKSLKRRTRKRSVEEIFHFAYIEASRYVHPETGKRIEVEELVALIGRYKVGQSAT